MNHQLHTFFLLTCIATSSLIAMEKEETLTEEQKIISNPSAFGKIALHLLWQLDGVQDLVDSTQGGINTRNEHGDSLFHTVFKKFNYREPTIAENSSNQENSHTIPVSFSNRRAIEVIQFCLKNNLDPKAINNDKQTALHSFALHGTIEHFGATKELLTHCPTLIAAQDKDGNIPLMSAMLRAQHYDKNKDVPLVAHQLSTTHFKISCLLNHGSNVMLANNKGESAYSLRNEKYIPEGIRKLIERNHIIAQQIRHYS